MKIYKYMGPEILKLAMQNEGTCNFKFSLPEEFNDPYELFLVLNFHQEPDLLATYRDAIGDIPQMPTTCFSRSPNVIPMWAHYAHNHSGVMIEFDEEIFLKHFPDGAQFGDVKYLEKANDDLLGILMRASRIGKPRYFVFLQQGVFQTAYFTKHSSWSYEQERRLIVDKKYVRSEGNMLLLDFPVECISALIVGHNASDETRESVSEIAEEIGANYFELKISKLNPEPYFKDMNNDSYLFQEGAITKCNHVCAQCEEPLSERAELCHWCSVEEHHTIYAQTRNPLRILAHVGYLEEYYQSMLDIGRKK